MADTPRSGRMSDSTRLLLAYGGIAVLLAGCLAFGAWFWGGIVGSAFF
ncbi:hypothetical protein [Marisediminicola sp. LYQ134]